MINDDNSADFVTILSSDMIADIVQVYFDTELYTNKKVKIVDLKPNGEGYAFSLAFVQTVEDVVAQAVPGLSQEEWNNFHRQEAIELKKMTEDDIYKAFPAEQLREMVESFQQQPHSGITYDIYDSMPGGTPIKRDGRYAVKDKKGRFVRNASSQG